MPKYLDYDGLKEYTNKLKIVLQNIGSVDNSNLVNGIGSSSLNQVQDGTTGTFDFTNKNPNATAIDSSLTGQIAYGGQGAFATSFGGKSSAQGKRSFACGTTTIAKGNYSFASGDNSVALGVGSFASGARTVAADIYSHSEGQDTQATGQTSHAEGVNTISSGVVAHAEGEETTASGYGSHAEGYSTKTTQPYSHSEGYSTTANGTASHAEGRLNTTNSEDSHVEGRNNQILNVTPSSADKSSSETGSSSAYTPENLLNVLGFSSHAEGVNNVIYGFASHVEGNGNTVSGHYSHAEGVSNNVSGKYSHAEGYGNTVNGITSHVEGSNNTVSDYNSHAEGEQTIARHRNSHAEGYQTQTGSAHQHVSGACNVGKSNTFFEVGNGSTTNRKNAFEVLQDGRAKVQSAPTEDDDVVRLKELNEKALYLHSMQFSGGIYFTYISSQADEYSEANPLPEGFSASIMVSGAAFGVGTIGIATRSDGSYFHWVFTSPADRTVSCKSDEWTAFYKNLTDTVTRLI